MVVILSAAKNLVLGAEWRPFALLRVTWETQGDMGTVLLECLN